MKKMKSSGAKEAGSRAEHRKCEGGQVLIEFVIMLVITTLLVFSLMGLFGAFNTNGRRLIDLVRFNVP